MHNARGVPKTKYLRTRTTYATQATNATSDVYFSRLCLRPYKIDLRSNERRKSRTKAKSGEVFGICGVRGVRCKSYGCVNTSFQNRPTPVSLNFIRLFIFQVCWNESTLILIQNTFFTFRLSKDRNFRNINSKTYC